MRLIPINDFGDLECDELWPFGASIVLEEDRIVCREEKRLSEQDVKAFGLINQLEWCQIGFFEHSHD